MARRGGAGRPCWLEARQNWQRRSCSSSVSSWPTQSQLLSRFLLRPPLLLLPPPPSSGSLLLHCTRRALMTCVKGRLTPHSPSMATRQHGQLEFLPRHCWRQDLQKVWPWRHAMRASQITSSQIAQQYGVSTGSRKSARSQPMILDRRAGQTQQKTGEPRKSCASAEPWRPKVGYISQRSADLGSGSVKCGASVRDINVPVVQASYISR